MSPVSDQETGDQQAAEAFLEQWKQKNHRIPPENRPAQRFHTTPSLPLHPKSHSLPFSVSTVKERISEESLIGLSVVAGDFNHDGFAELILSGDTIRLLQILIPIPAVKLFIHRNPVN